MGMSIKNIAPSTISAKRIHALKNQYPGLKFLDRRTPLSKSGILPRSLPIDDRMLDANLAYILGRDGMLDYARRINQTIRNNFKL